MTINLLDIHINLLITMDCYLPKQIEWYQGKKCTNKINLWEYLVAVDKRANKLCKKYCYEVSSKLLNDTITPMSQDNYQDSLEIYRTLILHPKGSPILYLLNYDVVIDTYYNINGVKWEAYSLANHHQSSNDYLLKLLGLIYTSVTLDYDTEFQVNILSVNTKLWYYYHNLIHNIFDISISIPKVGDRIICCYKLKYPEIQVYDTKNSYAIYPANNLYLTMTFAHLNTKDIKNIVIKNLDRHIYYCYHYDDYFGEQVIDSIDDDINIYREQLEKIYNNT